eukprot:4437117-Pyramimonas_sp.AAC.1
MHYRRLGTTSSGLNYCSARRVYKTHLWYEHCPKGARYIWVVRDPLDVAISFYRFFEGWFFEPGEVQLDEFMEQFILARGNPAS